MDRTRTDLELRKELIPNPDKTCYKLRDWGCAHTRGVGDSRACSIHVNCPELQKEEAEAEQAQLEAEGIEAAKAEYEAREEELAELDREAEK